MPNHRLQTRTVNGKMASPVPRGGSVASANGTGARHINAHSGTNTMPQEAQLKVLRLIESNPRISQREIAEKLNLSLGKANYCIHALIDIGWLKAKNFKNSANKLAYAYVLTPSGLRQRAEATMHFLERKRAEYEALRAEIELLEQELMTHEPERTRAGKGDASS